jgi:hypothetical protein
MKFFPPVGWRELFFLDGTGAPMIKDLVSDAASNATPGSMVVVLNWFEELKRLVP